MEPVDKSQALPRVLVVDDDPVELAYLGKLLSKIPVDAVPTTSCTLALYGLKRIGPFHMVIANAQLSDDALLLATKAKYEHGCATVIMSNTDPPDTGLPHGVDRWIVKPIELGALQGVVKMLAMK